MNWLEEICNKNKWFQEKVDIKALPVERQPCTYAIITCMDPRINLESAGIKHFKPNAELNSQIRIIRTLGSVAEQRSLVVGIHLAGIRELAVMMHTDCGCTLAHKKIDTIIKNLHSNLSSEKFNMFKQQIGKPFRERLREWLHTFEDPYAAVTNEVEAIKSYPFVPDHIIVHGLVYDLQTGAIDAVVNGYSG